MEVLPRNAVEQQWNVVFPRDEHDLIQAVVEKQKSVAVICQWFSSWMQFSLCCITWLNNQISAVLVINRTVYLKDLGSFYQFHRRSSFKHCKWQRRRQNERLSCLELHDILISLYSGHRQEITTGVDWKLQRNVWNLVESPKQQT